MMPAPFENGEKCDGSKICTSVHTILAQLGNATVTNSLQSPQNFDAKDVYLCLKKLSTSFESVGKVLCFHRLGVFTRCRFNMCRLEFCLQNLPF